jgi:ABC-type phosphate transport system auxiliary subunit
MDVVMQPVEFARRVPRARQASKIGTGWYWLAAGAVSVAMWGAIAALVSNFL